MSNDRLRPNKVPRPPPSTLDLQRHVCSLRLSTSIGYTGDADRDVAALLAVEYEALLQLAHIELSHGTDTELRAMAQRIVDEAAVHETMLKAWQARHAG